MGVASRPPVGAIVQWREVIPGERIRGCGAHFCDLCWVFYGGTTADLQVLVPRNLAPEARPIVTEQPKRCRGVGMGQDSI